MITFQEFIFVFDSRSGLWNCINRNDVTFPADVLDQYNFVVDDDCHFCRIKRNGYMILYRHYNVFRITIKIIPLK